MKVATVILVVSHETGIPQLVEFLSDDEEIAVFEAASAMGDHQPLQRVHDHRHRQAQEDQAFADYVEELLSQPYQRQEIIDHGTQWLKARLRIEEHQESEYQAVKIIANFGMQLYFGNPERIDFCLQGAATQVRVRIFVLPRNLNISLLA